jgi:hypothetical protein
MGPLVQVMPSPHKPFPVFLADQQECKTFSQDQVDGQASLANRGAAGGALLTTGIGGATGGLIGWTVGTPGTGAIVGASSVATGATASGIDVSRTANAGIQTQYDNAYVQCMYARGHQVPGVAPFEGGTSATPNPAPMPPGSKS